MSFQNGPFRGQALSRGDLLCTVLLSTVVPLSPIPGSEPLLILMEFAVYGSLKSYLTECRIGNIPARPQALPQAPPQATPQHLASLAGSAVHLCSYHQQQLLQLQGLGEYPNLHSSDSSSQLSLADPVSMAHARRLLQLLRSDYSYRYCSEYYYNHHEGQAEGSAQPENRDDPASSYSHLAPKHLASNYDRLAPLVAGGRCAFRPCLEDPYNYPPTRGENCEHTAYYNQPEEPRPSLSAESKDCGHTEDRCPCHSLGDGVCDHDHVEYYNQPEEPRLSPSVESEDCGHTEDRCPYHSLGDGVCDHDHVEYYNQSEGECQCGHVHRSSISLSQEEEAEPRAKTPPLVSPTYTNVPEQKAATQLRSSREENSPLVSPSYTNVPDPDYERQSMVSLPDGYIYSPASVCAYCSMQLSATIGCQGAEQGAGQRAEQEEGPRERQAAEVSQDRDSTVVGGGLTYFDVLDFGIQIARGMEHLGKMKVRKLLHALSK